MASSKIKVQFDGLKEFQKIIEEMEKENEQLMIDTIKELAARLLRKVIKRTPSDTGNLRKNWTVSDVRKNGENYEIEVSNSAEYASYVEFGHRQTPGRFVPAIGKRLKKSWVKGKFMLTISESELQKQAPAVIEKKITEWLKKLGG
nr:MAG TPA: type I neck protein [Caudoviricetes sp.]